jgi:hypothetical protein
VAQVLAHVTATFELPPTHSRADMLRFDLLSQLVCKVQIDCLHFPPQVLTVSGLPLSGAAVFPTLVSAAVQIDFANS